MNRKGSIDKILSRVDKLLEACELPSIMTTPTRKQLGIKDNASHIRI